MKIFCRKIIVNKPDLLKINGPVLLACNHPNSFLDGIIFDILLTQPNWALARGDVFKKSRHKKLLTAVNLLPVYRTSEGTQNVPENYKTFDACKDIFRKNGIVQIFSEGKCINEWHLRPLKKGTARLAISSWENNIPLRVLPVAINYSSFRRFGKNVFINFGEIMNKVDIDLNDKDGKRYQEFNDLLNAQLKMLVFEIDKNDIQTQQKMLERKPSAWQKVLFSIPAALGFLFHAPLYLPVKSFTWKRCNHNDHFDSVMAAILLFAYPVYLLLIFLLLYLLFHSLYLLIIFLILPFTAWSYVLLKSQLDKQ
ncbi:MAG: 1-acyl-sn-glycerol-3-phosphate acyltransferase [Chitinophagaceae bacterium]